MRLVRVCCSFARFVWRVFDPCSLRWSQNHTRPAVGNSPHFWNESPTDLDNIYHHFDEISLLFETSPQSLGPRNVVWNIGELSRTITRFNQMMITLSKSVGDSFQNGLSCRGTCNYEMINASKSLQREYQVTFEVCITRFVVACSPGFESMFIDQCVDFRGCDYLL
jgi:hypothetical protein